VQICENLKNVQFGEGPGLGLGLGLEGPDLGLVLGLWILALITTLFITNIAASLKATTINKDVYP